MKQFWPLVLVFISFNSVASQEMQHAPTVTQCRADQRLWFSKIEDETMAASIDFLQLRKWSMEMFDCISVDPERQDPYFTTDAEITTRQEMRLENFLERHHLFNQFLAEDAQGKR